MKILIVFTISLMLIFNSAHSQADIVSIKNDKKGITLLVNDQPFMINGMNWDYFPRGTNYSYSLWNQSDDIIKDALDAEMSLLKDMGVNAIRQYTGVPQDG